MTRLATLSLLFALGCSTLPARPAPTAPATPAIPEVSKPAETTTETARPGDEVLQLRVTGPGAFALVNVSDRAQHVLPPLDGSDVGWRVPSVLVEYRDADGNPVKKPGVGRCGNMNPLTPEDWVVLEPGEELSLPNGWMFMQTPEGAVEMRLTYDTTGAPTKRAFGDRQGDMAEFAKLPEGVWESDWAAISK